MSFFSEQEAKYFCSGIVSPGNLSNLSFRDYCKAKFNSTKVISEGNIDFNEYRLNFLSEVERNLFLSATNFVSAHRLLISGFASWAHVTLYYSSFYSARALLGMFGNYIGNQTFVAVNSGNIRNQKFDVKIGGSAFKKHLTSIGVQLTPGSHKILWGVFYVFSPRLTSYVQPDLQWVLQPIGPDPYWQTENRNNVNYETFNAVDLIKNFEISANIKKDRSKLPHPLKTQFDISDALIRLNFKFAKDFNFKTPALDNLPGKDDRASKLKRYVFSSVKGFSIENKMRQSLI